MSTSKCPTLSTAQQAGHLARGMNSAIARVVSILAVNPDHVRGLAMERALHIGAVDYGDASFHKSDADLMKEILEELADAIVYASIILGREKKA